jgi:hypothetical protein
MSHAPQSILLPRYPSYSLLHHQTFRAERAEQRRDAEVRPSWLEWGIGFIGSLPVLLILTTLLAWLVPQ